MKAHPPNLCTPLKKMMGQETKDISQVWHSFPICNNISEAETIPATEMVGFLPLSTMTNCNLSAQWKGLCNGGDCRALDVLLHRKVWQCKMLLCAEDGATEHIITLQSHVAELISTLNCPLEEIQTESKMA
jgi:hypothetical protein